jgi:hypothetical protein
VTTGPSTRVEVSVLGRLDMFLTTRERQSCSAGAPTSVWHRLSQLDTHICRLVASSSSSYPRMRHCPANMERYFSLTACPLPGCCISLLASLLGTLHKRLFAHGHGKRRGASYPRAPCPGSDLAARPAGGVPPAGRRTGHDASVAPAVPAWQGSRAPWYAFAWRARRAAAGLHGGRRASEVGNPWPRRITPAHDGTRGR